ncbi:MAG TPA: hypothetical protein VL068_02725, partial [Microthrixaceae bacterium]|nr:hypothetical protein [Microthrixaceae bacterium]
MSADSDSAAAAQSVSARPVSSEPASDEPALFVPHGDDWLPTSYSRGPWSMDSLHGGPVAALMTRAAEQVEAPIP